MEQIRRVTAATVDVLEALLAGPEPRWGLEVVKATGRRPGSVYPILGRLEALGWVTSDWEDDSDRPGPRRRYYRLTPDGTRTAVRTCAEFAAVNRARQPAPRPQPGTP